MKLLCLTGELSQTPAVSLSLVPAIKDDKTLSLSSYSEKGLGKVLRYLRHKIIGVGLLSSSSAAAACFLHAG